MCIASSPKDGNKTPLAVPTPPPTNMHNDLRIIQEQQRQHDMLRGLTKK
jgi:hypothetical protein